MNKFFYLLSFICLLSACSKSPSTPDTNIDSRLLLPLNIALFQSFIGKDSATIANQLKHSYQDSLNEFNHSYIIKVIYNGDSTKKFALGFFNLGKKTISQVSLDILYRKELTQKEIVNLTFDLIDSTYKINNNFTYSSVGFGDNTHIEHSIDGAKQYYDRINIYSKNSADFMWEKPEIGGVGNLIICQTNNNHIFWTVFNY